MLLLHTYFLADKLCMEELANSLNDIYKEGRKEVCISRLPTSSIWLTTDLSTADY